MREALFHATIDGGMSVQAALRTAEAGQLAGLSKDDQATLARMAYPYACELVRDEKGRRGAVRKVHEDTTEAARKLAARILALADREIARIERKPLKEPVDTGRATAAAKMAREALAVVRDATSEPKTSSKQTQDKPAAAPRPRTLAGVIAAGDETANTDAHTEEDDGGESAAPRATQTNEQTDEMSDGAVRSRAA